MKRPRASARVAWALLAVAVAAWLTLVEVFWLPLRVAGFLLPLSIVAAVGGNLLLPAAVHRLAGSRLVAVLPAITWLVVVVGAMIRRPEGDLVITGGGATGVVNLAFLLLGVVAAAFSVGRVLGGQVHAPISRPVDEESDGRRADSGTGGAR
jgi:hypothetical protein